MTTNLASTGTNAARSAHDLGAIRNALGILSEDRKKFRPEALRKATHLNQSQLAQTLGVSRPSVYKEEVVLTIKLKKGIVGLVMATDLVFELLNGDVDETAKWLVSPNSLLMGDTPFEVCMRGDAEVVLTWLNERLGKVAGPAF